MDSDAGTIGPGGPVFKTHDAPTLVRGDDWRRMRRDCPGSECRRRDMIDLATRRPGSRTSRKKVRIFFLLVLGRKKFHSVTVQGQVHHGGEWRTDASRDGEGRDKGDTSRPTTCVQKNPWLVRCYLPSAPPSIVQTFGLPSTPAHLLP